MNPDPSLTEVRTCELTFRWIAGYYSGVLSGFLSWQGKLCYFSLFDDTSEYWKYTIHQLTEEEADTATRNHEEFKARHGDHNDLLPDGSSAGGTSRGTIEEGAAAGDAIASAMAAGSWRPPISYHTNPVIGWFTSTTF